MRRTLLVALVAALAALGIATVAQAHRISLSKAYKSSAYAAQQVCNDDNTCIGRKVEACKRRKQHVARCKVHYYGSDEIGPYDCEWIDQYKIRRGSRKLIWNANVFEATFVCYDDDGGHFAPKAGKQSAHEVQSGSRVKNAVSAVR